MAKKIVFLTGAGMSAESGFSTFRDSGGLWEQYDVADVATPEGFARNPKLVLDFYNDRRRQQLTAQPNAGHRLVAKLETLRDESREPLYDVTVITQNVDNLHERAGSSHVIHLHGELMKATSSWRPNDSRQIITLPADKAVIEMGDKAADGSQLRPFIVWFGESVPNIEPAADECETADIFLIIGTSLNVYPAAGLLHYVPANAEVYLIDPKPVDTHSNRPVHVIQKGASEGMKEFIDLLMNNAKE